MTRRLAPAAALLGAVLSGAAPAAQQVFHGGTDTVVLNVSALDGRNHPVTDLARTDLQVFEDGVPQDMSIFATDPQPIALSILIDSSTSMESKLSVAADAATSLCRRLKPRDVAQIIDFNGEVRIRQPFTNDPALLERAIRDIHADGSTALYTAVYVAITELARVPRAPGELRRQAIVLLSDGDDTTSRLVFDDVLDRAKRSDVIVYAIGLRDKADRSSHVYSNALFELRSLAQTTGGRAFFPEAIAELPDIYRQIADEIASQYVVGYVSKNTRRDGAWRQIVLRTSRPDTVVRTKAGYFGPRDR